MKTDEQLEKEAAFNHKWAPYYRLSIQKWAEPMLEELYAIIELRKERYVELQNTDESEFNFGQTKEEFLENFKELLDGNYAQVALTFERIEAGEFVDQKYCNEKGVFYDMEAYYKDLIRWNTEKIDGLEDLLKKEQAPTRQYNTKQKIAGLKKANKSFQTRIDKKQFKQPEMNAEEINKDMKRSEQAGSKKQQLNNKAKELAERIKALEE